MFESIVDSGECIPDLFKKLVEQVKTGFVPDTENLSHKRKLGSTYSQK